MNMSRSIITVLSVLIICLFSTHTLAQEAVQRSNEMEFDARVVKGQRAEGAVYLFQRATRPLPPLLHYKRNYIGAIVSPIFGRDTLLGQQVEARVRQSQLKMGRQQALPIANPTKPNKETVKAKRKVRSKKKTSRKKWRRSKRKGRK